MGFAPVVTEVLQLLSCKKPGEMICYDYIGILCLRGKNMEKFNCKLAVVQCCENDSPKLPAPSIISHCENKRIELIKVTETEKVFSKKYDLTSTLMCTTCTECLLENL